MSRRPGNPARRYPDGGASFMSSMHPKSQSSPLLSIGLVFMLETSQVNRGKKNKYTEVPDHELRMMFWLGGQTDDLEAVSKVEGGVSCTPEVLRALPILWKAYGEIMNCVLHVGRETCPMVSKLLKDRDTEAWGVERYELDDVDNNCKSLVSKGVVHVADIKFPLPYGENTFSLVLISDALEYLSPRYLNKTLLELTRVSTDGIVAFTGYPGQHRAKVAELSKFGRPVKAKLRSSSWWVRYFLATRLEESEAAIKKFEEVSTKMSYKPACQVFHLSGWRKERRRQFGGEP